jgi:hypothetical protein
VAEPGAVGDEVGGERQVAARREDRRAMVAEDAVHQHHVAGADAHGAKVAAGRDHPDPRGGDEDPVGAAAADHLGVAGDDTHTGPVGLGAHGGGDPGQQRNLAAFLDDEGRGQPERHRAADREVVDSAADRQLADVAAGKLDRGDHETVGGEGQPRAGFGQRAGHQPGLVLGSVGFEGGGEDGVDQAAHGLAATAMGHGHMGFAQPADRGRDRHAGSATRAPPYCQ